LRRRSSRGISGWNRSSAAFSVYVSRIAAVGALFGTLAGAILLVGWLWLTNVALLFGAELNAEIEREKELSEGVPQQDTLNRPERGGSRRSVPAVVALVPLSSGPVAGRPQNSICEPITTVRSSGSAKYSTGSAEVLEIAWNSFLRHLAIPGASVGTMVIRDRK
jgi:Virulence factor BrkB